MADLLELLFRELRLERLHQAGGRLPRRVRHDMKLNRRRHRPSEASAFAGFRGSFAFLRKVLTPLQFGLMDSGQPRDMGQGGYRSAFAIAAILAAAAFCGPAAGATDCPT